MWLRGFFSSCGERGPLSSCDTHASHCSGFSGCGAGALGEPASAVAARGPSSCGAWASLLCRIWDLPRPGIKPVSPALAGSFFTTEPPAKLNSIFLESPAPRWPSPLARGDWEALQYTLWFRHHPLCPVLIPISPGNCDQSARPVQRTPMRAGPLETYPAPLGIPCERSAPEYSGHGGNRTICRWCPRGDTAPSRHAPGGLLTCSGCQTSLRESMPWVIQTAAAEGYRHGARPREFLGHELSATRLSLYNEFLGWRGCCVGYHDNEWGILKIWGWQKLHE